RWRGTRSPTRGCSPRTSSSSDAASCDVVYSIVQRIGGRSEEAVQMKPTTPHVGEAREAHLRDYGRVLWQGRYTIAAIFIAVVGLTFLRVSFSTPIYEAGAAIEIKPQPRQILPGQGQWVGAEGGGWLAEEKYFNTQLEVLRSRDVAER